MKQINGKKPFLAVPVPKDTKCWQKRKRLFIQKNLAGGDIINLEEYDKVKLLGKLSELTEEQAAELVERSYKCCHCEIIYLESEAIYDRNGSEHCPKCNTINGGCPESVITLKSLFQSNDCWMKEWIEVGREKLYDSNDTSPESIYYHKQLHKRMKEAAEDFLIILID